MSIESFVWRGRAPLRLGLAGGGTDVSPYCEEFGGAVLNVAINRFAHASLAHRSDNRVVFIAKDLGETDTFELGQEPSLDDGLVLHRALYNRIVRDFNDGRQVAMTIITSVECPRGAGLGASSALVVAMIEAFKAMFGLALGKYDVARLAFDIERVDAKMAGGRQDQYAAAFGGVNYIEFASRERVIVNPLALQQNVVLELESSLLLYFTGVSRNSSDIILKQVSAMKSADADRLEALHLLKRESLEIKTALLHSELAQVAEIMNRGWEAKKATAQGISSPEIDALHRKAMDAGALGGKISGAGGGGFMIFLVEPILWPDVEKVLIDEGGRVSSCTFSKQGSAGWRAPRNAWEMIEYQYD